MSAYHVRRLVKQPKRLLKLTLECGHTADIKRASGGWHVTHAIEVVR